MVRAAGAELLICSYCVALCVELVADAEQENDGTRMSAHPRGLACSFCNASGRAVKHLIAGPTIYICDATVAQAAMLTRTALERQVRLATRDVNVGSRLRARS